MFTVKTLSGSLLSLPVSSEEEFGKEYMLQYVKPEYRPFVKLHVEDGCLLVNLCPILPELQKYLECTEIWQELSKNPGAISLLREHPEKIDWRELSANPGAIELLKENLDKVDWDYLSCNERGEDLFRLCPDLVKWYSVAEMHPNASELVRELAPQPHAVYLLSFCLNPHVQVEWIEEYVARLEPIHWTALSKKASMVPLLERYPECIVKESLLDNPGALELIKRFYVEDNDRAKGFYRLMYNPSREVADWVSTLPEYSKCIESWMLWREKKNKPRAENVRLASRRSPAAVCFFETLQSPGEFWSDICSNPLAAHLIEKFVGEADGDMDGIIVNPAVCHLVPKYIDSLLSGELPLELFSLSSIMCPDPSRF
jgi:hypothetical protein